MNLAADLRAAFDEDGLPVKYRGLVMSAALLIEGLRERVALLRHAADLNAESLAEQQRRADHLQALIDAWATARSRVTIEQGWDTPMIRVDLLAAATPKEDDRG